MYTRASLEESFFFFYKKRSKVYLNKKIQKKKTHIYTSSLIEALLSNQKLGELFLHPRMLTAHPKLFFFFTKIHLQKYISIVVSMQ